MVDAAVNRARKKEEINAFYKNQSINQLIIDEAFNTGRIIESPKKTNNPGVHTRITRRREESLQQWPNEEGGKDHRRGTGESRINSREEEGEEEKEKKRLERKEREKRG